jgi:alpha-1,2-mannosyltransferase
MSPTTIRVISILVFAALPVLMLTLMLAREFQLDDVAVDFTDSYYPAGELLLGGDSPYTESLENLAERTSYVYPPLTAAVVAPFTILPPRAAGVVWTALLLVAAAGTLAVAGVRDWRLLGLVLLWPSTLSAIQTASVTLVLGLLCALGWRYRDRRVLAGLFIGVGVALKFFLWPLVVWLLATRRYVSAAIAAVVAGLSTLSILLFLSLGEYVDLVRELTDLVAHDGYTIFALLLELEVAEPPARLAQAAAGGALLVLGRKSFVLCLGAALLLAPIVWLHYFALLAVPLGVAGAPLTLWLIPLAMWLVPGGSENGAAWQIALALGAATLTIAKCARLETRLVER